MWAEGSIKIENSIFHYWVKHYEEPVSYTHLDVYKRQILMRNF